MNHLRIVYFLFLLFSLGVVSQAQRVNSGALSFEYSAGALNGSSWSFTDTTYLGFEKSGFKRLLAIKGNIHLDTAQSDTFYLDGPAQVFARVGNSGPQLLWTRSGTGTMAISIPMLLSDSGITAGSGATVLLAGMQVQVERFGLIASEDSLVNRSSVGVSGTFYLPETGNKISHSFSGAQRLRLRDNQNYASSFQSIYNISFTLRNAEIRSNNLHLNYDETNQEFSLFGGVVYRLDSNTIPCLLGDSSHPGMIYKEGALISLHLIANDTFRLFGQKFHPENFNITLDGSDTSYSLFGSLGFETEGSVVRIQLGDSASPGAIGHKDQLLSFRASLSDTFAIRNLSFEPRGLTMAYDTNSSGRFFIFGDVVCLLRNATTMDRDSVFASFGTESNPGLEINHGELSRLGMSISTEFSMKGLRFDPQPAGILYRKSDQSYALYGNMGVANDSMEYHVDAGDSQNPGIVIRQGKLDQLNLSIDDTIKVKGLTFIPKPLAMHYKGGSAETFSLYGEAIAMLGQDTLTTTWGDQDKPGLSISEGTLQSLSLGVSGNFKLLGLSIRPDTLTLHYEHNRALYEMYGGLTVLMEGDTITCTLGDKNQAGLSYSNGAVQHVNMQIDADFELKSIAFSADPVHFVYDHAEGRYEISGNADISFDGQHMNVELGRDTLPGIAIRNGILESIELGLTDTFKIKGLVLSPDSLIFNYDKAGELFRIFGKSGLIIETDTMTLTLGTEALPGIEIENGEVQDIDLGVSADFKIGGMEFQPEDLTLEYIRSTDRLGIFGLLRMKFEGNDMRVNMGDQTNPGLLLQTSTGSLQHLKVSIDSTHISLYTLSLELKNYGFEYRKSTKAYAMWGDAVAVLVHDTFGLSMGTESDPGFLLVNGSLNKLNFSITDSLRLYSLSMKANGLGFQYNQAGNYYGVYGAVTAHFSQQTISAALGTSKNPGLVIRNGVAEKVDLTVTGNIKIAGVSFETVNGFTFKYDHANSYYEMFGNLKFTLEGEMIEANLGNETTPGLTIRQGSLYEMNLGISSNISIGGLQMTTRNLGMYYTQTSGGGQKYVVRGLLTVNELWSISTTLGNTLDPNRGLEIITDGKGHCTVDVTDFTIEAKHVSFGGVTFNDILVSYKTVVGGFDIDAKVDVSFPSGFEVSGEVEFEDVNNKFIFEKISLAYDAGTSTGIEIGETGVFVVHMDGTVELIAAPNDYQFVGDIGLSMGGQLTLQGISCTMMRMNGQVKINKDELYIKDVMYLGAYENAGKWHALLGETMVEFTMDWGDGIYSVAGSTEYGQPVPFVRFLANAEYYSTGAFGALGEVDLFVPNAIPLIGGKTLASIDGAVRYSKPVPSESFAAGWMDIDLEVKKVTAGIEYNFDSKHVKKIGASDVDDLQQETQTLGSVSYQDFSFRVDQNVKAVTINFKPKSSALYSTILFDAYNGCSVGGIQNGFDILTPDNNVNQINFTCLLSEIFKKQNGMQNNAGAKMNMGDYVLNADSISANGFLLHLQANTLDEQEQIIPGKYTLTCYFTSLAAYFDFEFQQHYFDAQNHDLTVQVDNSGERARLNGRVETFTGDSAILNFYVTNKNATAGTLFHSIRLHNSHGSEETVNTFYQLPAKQVTVFDSSSNSWVKKTLKVNEDYYFYTELKDGVGKPILSDVKGPYSMGPAFGVVLQPTLLYESTSGPYADVTISFQQKNTVSGATLISLYYDFDQTGYNGYPIAELQKRSLSSIQEGSKISCSMAFMAHRPSTTHLYLYAIVGSSRVDLQACKLEYSIVSPK